jgi:leucyl aminopeptidase
MANGLDISVVVKEQLKEPKNAALLLHARGKGKPAGVDPAYANDVAKLAQAGFITGKAGSISNHLLANGTRLIVVGLGEKEKISADSYRTAGGALAKLAREQKLSTLAVLSPEDPAAVVTGFILRGFEYTDYKGSATREGKDSLEVTLTLAGKYTPERRSEIDRAVIIAQAQNYARSIASRPGNDINPPSLAKVAQQLAKEVGLGITILDEKKMKQLGMGGILGVGGGSPATPPRMIALEWNGSGRAKIEDRGSKIEDRKTPKAKRDPQSSILDPRSSTLLVVGKAITFDTGGISIKQAPGMQKMIFDKCGGMAVLGLMHAVANLKLNCRVVGILAAAENHISDTAYRPGDILKMYNGVTVEVTNTDAEGRLVLGDALAWGIETYKPAAVVNLATLTGGVIVALGKTMAGIMSNNDGLVAELEMAAKLTGEKMWRLPIGEDQRELLKSDFADIVNSGPREAHPLQGGAFLSYFVPEKLPWAHIDIAGVADTEKELPLSAKGATGWGVRTLVEWVSRRTDGIPF